MNVTGASGLPSTMIAGRPARRISSSGRRTCEGRLGTSRQRGGSDERAGGNDEFAAGDDAREFPCDELANRVAGPQPIMARTVAARYTCHAANWLDDL